MKYLLSIQMLFFALAGCEALAATDEFRAFERRMNSISKKWISGLKNDMTIEQVERVIGRPDNADWKQEFPVDDYTVTVWLWVEKHPKDFLSWRDYTRNPPAFGLCYYAVFIDGRLRKKILVPTSKEAQGLFILCEDVNAQSAKKKPTQ